MIDGEDEDASNFTIIVDNEDNATGIESLDTRRSLSPSCQSTLASHCVTVFLKVIMNLTRFTRIMNRNGRGLIDSYAPSCVARFSRGKCSPFVIVIVIVSTGRFLQLLQKILGVLIHNDFFTVTGRFLCPEPNKPKDKWGLRQYQGASRGTANDSCTNLSPDQTKNITS